MMVVPLPLLMMVVTAYSLKLATRAIRLPHAPANIDLQPLGRSVLLQKKLIGPPSYTISDGGMTVQ